MIREGCGSILRKIHLNDAFAEIGIICGDHRIIQGIHEDSRWIARDWVFIIRNERAKCYCRQALEKGAVVLCETMDLAEEHVYVVKDIEWAMDVLLRFCYPSFCEDLLCIGITGTNGKSSTAYFLYQCLSSQLPCMWIGTHRVLSADFEEEIANTTPDVCELVRLIEKGKMFGIRCFIMEVSSHAIAQKRIRLMRYDYIVFTNVYRDHLDYHRCEAHYRYTKYALRTYVKKGGKILVNHDDPFLRPIYHLVDGECVTYGTQLAHFWLHDVHADADGLRFYVNKQAYQTNICGQFQTLNLTAVITLCSLYGMSNEAIKQAIKNLNPLKGRLQRVWKHPYVFIDYAHTASACGALFASVRSFPHERIITVIGCGGERDQEKRAQMGNIASINSDLCIFTSDNPRNEPLSQIFAMMCSHIRQNVMIFEQRAYAIKFAVKNSRNDDIILVVGKGDERWQMIGEQAYPFDDEALLCYMLREKEEHA